MNAGKCVRILQYPNWRNSNRILIHKFPGLVINVRRHNVDVVVVVVVVVVASSSGGSSLGACESRSRRVQQITSPGSYLHDTLLHCICHRIIVPLVVIALLSATVLLVHLCTTGSSEVEPCEGGPRSHYLACN